MKVKDLAIGIAKVRHKRDADPMKSWEFNSVVQRRFAEYVCAGIETYIRAANKFGKSEVGGRLAVAFARCLASIGVGEWGTVQLPALPCPNVGVVLIPSFGQSVESAVAAVKRALGNWPHHEAKIAGNLGYVGCIYVATHRCPHGSGKQCNTCSRMYFISGEGKVPAGFQVDWIWADEPPGQEHWQELRFRSRANATFYAWITATPLERKYYAWLEKDFRGCFNVPKGGKVELVATLMDNRFLSKAYIRAQLQRAEKDPYAKARIYGEYVDVTQFCPFSYSGLQRWLGRAEQPRRAVVEQVTRDGEDIWVLKEHPRGSIEIHEDPVEGEFYMLMADPSSGIRDREKSLEDQTLNPAGFNMVGIRSRKHVARFNGYVSASELGKMCRVMCDAYNHALFIPEMNGGWGETMLTAFGFDYSNVYVDVRVSDRSSSRSKKVGWYQTHSKRGLLTGALQRAIDEDGIDVRNASLVQHLMATRMEDDATVLTAREGDGRGSHGEDMVTLGVLAHLLEITPVPGPPLEKDPTPSERFREMLKQPAKTEDDPDLYGGRSRKF